MLCALLLSASTLETPAREALLAALDRYGKLESFKVRILQPGGQPLFPGKFEQRFEWARPNRFALVVTNPDATIPLEERCRDYLGDGKQVEVRFPNHSKVLVPQKPGKAQMPPWEVLGGPIVRRLLDTATWRLMKKPPKSIQIAFQWRDPEPWEGLEAKTIEVRYQLRAAEGESMGPYEIERYYFDADLTDLLGFGRLLGGQEHRIVYRDAVRDPSALRLVPPAPRGR